MIHKQQLAVIWKLALTSHVPSMVTQRQKLCCCPKPIVSAWKEKIDIVFIIFAISAIFLGDP